MSYANDKPSPGPWRWWRDASYDNDMPHLLDASGEEVCSFGDNTQYYPTEGKPPKSANAALIADAPAMLDLLQTLEYMGRSSEPGSPVGMSVCVLCKGVNGSLGHKPGCELGAMLDKHGRRYRP